MARHRSRRRAGPGSDGAVVGPDHGQVLGSLGSAEPSTLRKPGARREPAGPGRPRAVEGLRGGAAEREGFEPPVRQAHSGFQDRHIRPLCHLSMPLRALPTIPSPAPSHAAVRGAGAIELARPTSRSGPPGHPRASEAATGVRRTAKRSADAVETSQIAMGTAA